MFGRKKQEQGLFNMMDDSRVTVHDFIRRFIFESYRALDYRVYHKLSEEEMKPELDHYLEALFSGEVDDANGDMLDNIVFGPYRESAPDLRIQRINHKDMNRRLIGRRVTDRDDFAKIGESRKAELEKLKQEYEDTCHKIAVAEEERV